MSRSVNKKLNEDQEALVIKHQKGTENGIDIDKAPEMIAENIDYIEKKQESGSIKSLEETSSRLERSRQAVISALISYKTSVADVDAGMKKASGSIRASLDKVSSTLAKINRHHDIETIERQAKALADMADSLERISKLKESGRLDKIIQAVA